MAQRYVLTGACHNNKVFGIEADPQSKNVLQKLSLEY